MQGLQFVELSRGRRIGNDAEKRVAALLEQISGQCDVLLITSELDARQRLPMNALAAGEIFVQVSRRPNAITSGYSAIKSLTRVTGRRSFGVLVTDTPENEAKALHANMAEAASRFLAVSLGFVGSIPPDDSVRRACDMKRSVIEVFPLAEAANALRRISEAIVQAADCSPASPHPAGMTLMDATPA
jgi:flagellar biosynthesis protein FlhG